MTENLNDIRYIVWSMVDEYRDIALHVCLVFYIILQVLSFP